MFVSKMWFNRFWSIPNLTHTHTHIIPYVWPYTASVLMLQLVHHNINLDSSWPKPVMADETTADDFLIVCWLKPTKFTVFCCLSREKETYDIGQTRVTQLFWCLNQLNSNFKMSLLSHQFQWPTSGCTLSYPGCRGTDKESSAKVLRLGRFVHGSSPANWSTWEYNNWLVV